MAAKAIRASASSEFWSRRYGRDITQHEARSITANLCGMFRLLLEWDEDSRKSVSLQPQNDTESE